MKVYAITEIWNNENRDELFDEETVIIAITSNKELAQSIIDSKIADLVAIFIECTNNNKSSKAIVKKTSKNKIVLEHDINTNIFNKFSFGTDSYEWVITEHDLIES